MFSYKLLTPRFRAMNRWGMYAVFCLTVFGCAKGEEPAPDYSEDLVYNFPFSGNSVDEVSQQEFETHGATYLSDRHGNENASAFFNSEVKTYMNLDAGLNEKEGTLAFWIFPCLCNEYNPLFVKKNLEADSSFGKYYVGYDEQGRIMTSCMGKWDITSGVLIQPNQWYHLAFRWNDAEKKIDIFVNGKKKVSETYNADPSDTPVDWSGSTYMGRIVDDEGGPATVYYRGKIDEVRRYSKWVIYDEIKKLNQ